MLGRTTSPRSTIEAPTLLPVTLSRAFSPAVIRCFCPASTLRYGQRKQLTEWLEKLQSGGAESLTAETGMFSLTAKQLVTLHEALKRKVTFTTKGKSVEDAVEQIAKSLQVTVEIDPAAKAAMLRNNEVLDELQGFSSGTALTALVRPAGLVVTPTGQGKRTVGLRVTESGNAKETWPIGTSPKEPPDRLVPALFRFINVEINDQPLGETLDIIQQRIKIPILFDHNALARHEVDLQTKVSLPAKNTFYKKIIDQLLFQALLKCELRTDEADQPFLWVTTVKK